METEIFSGESTAAKVEMMSLALNDRYRCPEKFFDLFLSEQPSSGNGYFRFGANTICYGRSCAGARGPRPESPLYDVLRDVVVKGGKLGLPFDLTEVLDNLRLERYANSRGLKSSFEEFCRKLYYRLRPFMNLTVRKQIQKLHARDWKKRSFPKWPVDTTVEDICETVLLMSMRAKGVDRVPFVWFWPDGASGCLMMTHDVETTAGRDYCSKLMDLNDSFGIKAAFGIIPEERYEVSSNLLESIRNRGFEVIIQDLNHDGRLFDSKEGFLRRAKIINRYAREYGAKGFRAAILYRKPDWYGALEFSFDTSFPNVAPLDPQRGGCCTVMPYFIGDVLELPVTTIQDYTLFHVLNERSIDLWKAQADQVLGKNGLLSFIVHPDYLLEQDTLSVYEGLLDHLRELRKKKHIWSALPAEIDSWWRARRKMSVVQEGNSWKIEGDDTGRAVLAFAKNVDGKIAYELAQASETA
jgi:hypothetical protein